VIGDIWTVMWKEWKELLIRRGSARTGWLSLAIVILVMGIAPAMQTGPAWVNSVMTVVFSLWMPLFLVPGLACDAFAGERERHTLETLLASRLSDHAILVGKMATMISYGWMLTLVTMLVSLVAVNVAHGGGGLLLYPPTIGIGIVVSGLLTSWLAAGVGILVSLRASSVRQAQQTISIARMVLVLGPTFGAQALPVEWKATIARALLGIDLVSIALIVALVIALIDAGLLVAAMLRFRRPRLILES
jgi:ABC-2 type transport system permease protein